MSTNGTNKTPLSKAEKARAKQLQNAMKPSSQNTIKYTSLFEDGMMHITGEYYSKTWELGDANYLTVTEDDKIDIIDNYAECLNGFDSDNVYQLTILNRPIPSNMLDKITYELTGDKNDDLRSEYNKMIASRFATDQKNFQVKKFITVSTDSHDIKTAYSKLKDIENNLTEQFKTVDINIKPLN